jgi:hypothetical protein
LLKDTPFSSAHQINDDRVLVGAAFPEKPPSPGEGVVTASLPDQQLLIPKTNPEGSPSLMHLSPKASILNTILEKAINNVK